MSAVLIRGALETAVNGMSPSLATAWENAAFTPPVPTTPYQLINILFARPENTEAGTNHVELGFMQVKLMYPLNIGSATAGARAELLRTTFTRGNTFTSGSVTVTVTDTPEIAPSTIEDGRYSIIVRIRFRSFIPS